LNYCFCELPCLQRLVRFSQRTFYRILSFDASLYEATLARSPILVFFLSFVTSQGESATKKTYGSNPLLTDQHL